MGDIHGSVHALLRNLLVMFQSGWLRDNFTLADNVHLMFLGDLTDRGLYGVESIFTILKLKHATWDRVHIVRGNHENIQQVENYGFFAEIDAKYGPHLAQQMKEAYERFCTTLPSALFLGVHDGVKRRFIQCCHGGLAQSHDVATFLGRPSSRRFERIDAVAATSYQWNDVCCAAGAQKIPEIPEIPEDVVVNQAYLNTIQTPQETRGGASSSSSGLSWMPSCRGGSSITLHRDDITKIMAARNICMLMRGHQDDWGSCKILADVGCEQGPRPWYCDDRFGGHNFASMFRQGVKLPDWANCTTLTTATEARALESEGFMGIVLGNSLEDSSVTVYDAWVQLQQDHAGAEITRHGRFVACGALPEALFDVSMLYTDLKSPAIWLPGQQVVAQEASLALQPGLTPVLMGYAPRGIFMPENPVPLVFGRGSVREALDLRDLQNPSQEVLEGLAPEKMLAGTTPHSARSSSGMQRTTSSSTVPEVVTSVSAGSPEASKVVDLAENPGGSPALGQLSPLRVPAGRARRLAVGEVSAGAEFGWSSLSLQGQVAYPLLSPEDEARIRGSFSDVGRERLSPLSRAIAFGRGSVLGFQPLTTGRAPLSSAVSAVAAAGAEEHDLDDAASAAGVDRK